MLDKIDFFFRLMFTTVFITMGKYSSYAKGALNEKRRPVPPLLRVSQTETLNSTEKGIQFIINL